MTQTALTFVFNSPLVAVCKLVFDSVRRRLIATALIVSGAFLLPLQPAFAQIPDAPFGYVTDLPEILSDSEREALADKLRVFEEESSTQIFVLIAQDLGGRDEFTVTFETASQWGVGQAGKDNGVLIALYMADRKIRIEVGYGLEGSVPDALANQIIRDTMVPHMRDGSPYLAIDGAIDRLIAASRGEFSADGDDSGAEEIATDTYSESDYPFETFDNDYIPPWGQLLLIASTFIYAAIALLYAIFGGITAEFNQKKRQFDFRYDFVEFLSELIATQIVVAFLAGLPTLFLFFVFEEFQIHGYGFVIAAPIIVIGFYLRSMFLGPAKERQSVRAKTENLNAWRKLTGRFDADDVEELRAYFHSRLRRWRPGFALRVAYEELDKHVGRALKKPESYFVYTEAYARKRISPLLADGDFWKSARANFVIEQVERKFKGLTERRDKLFGAQVYDAAAGDELLKDLEYLHAGPEHYFDYSLSKVTKKIASFLDDNALWSKWRMRDTYVPSRVNRKRKKLRAKFAELQKTADERERRESLNKFYKSEATPVRDNPGNHFKAPKRSSSGSGYSGSYSYSSGSSSFSSSSFSSSSSSSSFGGGGGGSFGGGGASGSW